MAHWFARAAVVACLLLPRAASAAPIVWQMNGEIAASPSGNPLEGFLPVGTDVNFLLKVDAAASDLCDAAGAGLYALSGARVSFGGNDYAASSAYLEADNPDGSCIPSSTGTTIRAFFDMAPFQAAVITWPGIGEALPLVPPSSAQFWMSYAYPDATVAGDLASNEVAPEPSTLLLMLPALSAIVVRLRSRR